MLSSTTIAVVIESPNSGNWREKQGAYNHLNLELHHCIVLPTNTLLQTSWPSDTISPIREKTPSPCLSCAKCVVSVNTTVMIVIKDRASVLQGHSKQWKANKWGDCSDCSSDAPIGSNWTSVHTCMCVIPAMALHQQNLDRWSLSTLTRVGWRRNTIDEKWESIVFGISIQRDCVSNAECVLVSSLISS